MRIPASLTLLKNVADADSFDNGTDRTAGNNARSFEGRFQEDAARPEVSEHFMRNGASVKGNREQVLLGLLAALANRLRHFVGLAKADANAALAVTNDNLRGERKPATALNDFCAAVDMNHAVSQLLFT